MSNLLSSEELQTRFTIPAFLQKTIDQLNKDLARAGLEWRFEVSEQFELDALCERLNQRLRALASTHSRTFQQLLYTIDLPEDLAAEEEKLAEFMLRREAYKVYLREKFSNL